MDQCIKEVLRLRPTVPIMGRELTEDCHIDGYLLPKGTQTYVSAWNVHRHEDFWTDPERFDPDRFSRDNSVGWHPFAFVPFAAGQRNCIGQRFAWDEMKVMITKLLRHFRLVTHQRIEEVRPLNALVLKPDRKLDIELLAR